MSKKLFSSMKGEFPVQSTLPRIVFLHNGVTIGEVERAKYEFRLICFQKEYLPCMDLLHASKALFQQTLYVIKFLILNATFVKMNSGKQNEGFMRASQVVELWHSLKT